MTSWSIIRRTRKPKARARAWARLKAEVRLEIAREKEKEKEKARGAQALGGLMGYEDSDEGEGNEEAGDGKEGAQKENGATSVNASAAETKDERAESGTGDDEAIKEARRARAKEWAEKRRAERRQT